MIGVHGLSPIIRGVICFTILAGAALVPAVPAPAKVVCVLAAPLFAGFIAAARGPRPISQAVLACLMGAALLAAYAAVTADEPPVTADEAPVGGRDLLPLMVLLAYSGSVGWVAGAVTAREQRRGIR